MFISDISRAGCYWSVIYSMHILWRVVDWNTYIRYTTEHWKSHSCAQNVFQLTKHQYAIRAQTFATPCLTDVKQSRQVSCVIRHILKISRNPFTFRNIDHKHRSRKSFIDPSQNVPGCSLFDVRTILKILEKFCFRNVANRNGFPWIKILKNCSIQVVKRNSRKILHIVLWTCGENVWKSVRASLHNVVHRQINRQTEKHTTRD